MPSLSERKLCTGCTACVNICPLHCIEMTMDKYGFVYPYVKEHSKCISCGLCERVCPVQKRKSEEESIRTSALAAYSKDSSIRKESSSGGIFSEIAIEVLDKGGVVFGAAFDQNYQVRHIGVEQAEDLHLLRGAKYSESRLNGVFSEILKYLKGNRLILFSGTPCQVAGLKAFLQRDYENLLCIDFVCHGIPSPKVWEKYIFYRSLKDNNGTLPFRINMRDKVSGWSYYRYSNSYHYAEGKVFQESSSDSLFMKLFTQDYILRYSCSDCRFKGYSRVSDITLGDFWGIWDILPEMDDDRGTSLVLIQSEAGRNIWNKLRDRIVYQNVELEQASMQNPSILVSARVQKGRRRTLDMICRQGFKEEITFKTLTDSFVNRLKCTINKYL